MTNHYTDVCEETIKSLRQQLADSQKQVTLLRDALEKLDGRMIVRKHEIIVKEALAATKEQ